jgi:hypothetical protein
MTLAQDLADAWRDHATAPDAVYDRVRALTSTTGEDDVAGVVRLLLHVGIEHLDRDADVEVALDELARSHPDAPAVLRARAALAALSTGTLAPLAALSAADAGGDEALALAVVLGLAGARGAEDLANEALARVSATFYRLPPGHLATRSLGMATNNLACALETQPARTEVGRENLRTSATLARALWERAGTWLEVERAEYRLAKAHLALGEVGAAVSHAETCLAMCRGNASGPGELVYAWEVLAESCLAAGATRRAQEALSWAKAMVDAPDFPAALAPDARKALERITAKVA